MAAGIVADLIEGVAVASRATWLRLRWTAFTRSGILLRRDVVGGDLAGRDVIARKDWIGTTVIAPMARQTVQQVQCVSCGNIVVIVLREGAQMPLAPNMYSWTEGIAGWYVSYNIDEAAETPTKAAYGAQSATAAIDAEGGD